MQNYISANNLSKIYSNGEVHVHALNRASLSLKKGECVAVVGASGSGKSTLLNILGGLLSPTEGKVYIDGISICDLDETELSEFRRDKIGFIFQHYNLIPVINAYENITLPIRLGGHEVDESHVNSIINTLNLKEQLLQMPHTLSGGQMQRVGIARALATKPALILADEPTGNLDSRTSIETIELMRCLATELNQTMIIITHDEKIASYADRILYMEDGKISETAL